ncbi:MAG: hypothetical protein M9894_11355 [Planctomycetes bacterium]|nr:hypothetical protein [Planctomycetota bacterium]
MDGSLLPGADRRARADDDGARVFERRLGPWRGLGLVGLALLVPLALAALWRHRPEVRDLVEALGAPFGQVTSAGALAALALAPVAAFVLALRLAATRFGRCVAGPDWLEVVPGHLPGWWARLVVRRDEVVERIPDPHGVWLRAADGTRARIPAASPGALEDALAELDRRDLEPPVSNTRAEPRWVAGIGVAWGVTVLASAAGLTVALARRFEPGLEVAGVMTIVLVSLPLGLLLFAALIPTARRVHVGRRAVAVGEEVFAYEDLERVGVDAGTIACEGGGRTCIARVGADEAAIRAALERRLRQAGRHQDDVLGPLPAWARAGRRRLRAALRGGPAFVVPLALVTLGWTAPNQVLVRWEDVHGQALYLVHARDGDRPTAVVLAPPGTAVRTANWWPRTLTDGVVCARVVDLARGEVREPGAATRAFAPGATFVHVREDEVVASRIAWSPSPCFDAWSEPLQRQYFAEAQERHLRQLLEDRPGVEVRGTSPSVPEVVEAMAEGLLDRTIRAAGQGWTTRCCFDVLCPTGSERLLWGVRSGEVAFVARGTAKARLDVQRGDMGRVVEPPGSLPLDYKGFRSLRQEFFDRSYTLRDGPLAVRLDDFGTFTEDPTLPTDHATLLAVRAKVLAGATLAQALAEARQ